MFQSLFHAWERRLAYTDDGERRVLPFAWGTEFLPEFANWERRERNGASDRVVVHEHVRRALAESTRYFEPKPTSDFRLDGDELSFTSPAPTSVSENDRVRALYFPSENGRGHGPAVLVLPHWNAKEGAQDGLCRLLNAFGLSALKLILPYHEKRMPEGLVRADPMLSPSVGRTLESCRQAVLDARAAIGWLASEGHGPLGIVGTSLGSAIAFVVNAHEPRLDASVFNHISPYFADVVWRGISTRQVREGLERGVSLDELRALWLPMSPYSYYEHVARRPRPTLLIHARYDLSFPPDLSRDVLRDLAKLEIDYVSYELPCGHYTTAKFPFNWMDGLRIARFLKKTIGR